MELIRSLLMEYYRWITMAGCALTLILLAVALHKIRKLKKQLKEMEGKAGQILECVEYTAEAHRTEAREMKFWMRPQEEAGGGQAGGHGAVSDKPEELIDAVLEEVFL